MSLYHFRRSAVQKMCSTKCAVCHSGMKQVFGPVVKEEQEGKKNIKRPASQTSLSTLSEPCEVHAKRERENQDRKKFLENNGLCGSTLMGLRLSICQQGKEPVGVTCSLSLRLCSVCDWAVYLSVTVNSDMLLFLSLSC